MKTHLTKISFIFKCCGHYHISFKPFKFLSFTIIFVNIIHHTLLPRKSVYMPKHGDMQTVSHCFNKIFFKTLKHIKI